jgi:hypothetical protein
MLITTTICFGSRSKQRQVLWESHPPPLRIGPVQHHYGFDPFQIASSRTTCEAFEASDR